MCSAIPETSEKINRLEDRLICLSAEHDSSGQFSYRHVHTNDLGYGQTLVKLAELPAVETSGIPIGVIIGTGGILSAAPELPVETLILLDMNPVVLQWVKYTAHVLNHSISPENYRKSVYSPANPYYLKGSELIKLEDALEAEMQSFGNKHFLFDPLDSNIKHNGEQSDNRFQACQKALRSKRLLIVAGDLETGEFISKFSQALIETGTEITFANFTNVTEWIGLGAITHFLTQVPVNDRAIILFSSQPIRDTKLRRICRGPEEFLERVQIPFER